MAVTLSTDEFTALIYRSGLLSAAILAPYLERKNSASEPLSTAELSRELLKDRLLTNFQARQLLHGRHRGFFLTEKYKILEVIGEGGMGRVLLCEHLVLHRIVAVKLLHSASDVPGAGERFLREARAAAALDHPNVTRVFDADRSPAGPFMVMEYVDGTNLHALVATHGRLMPGLAANYVRQAADGLQHAHENGLIHRDIKPGNLMVDRTGIVKLLDHGLARFFDPLRNDNITRRFDPTNVLGTADFIAPEQAMNSSNVDIRADVYSLGCTLYYLLTGHFPFPDGSAMQKLVAHQTQEPRDIKHFRSDVPEGLLNVLRVMTKKDPAERYQTPAEAAAALSLFSTAITPPPAQQMPQVRPSAYRLGLSPPPSSPDLKMAGPASPFDSVIDDPYLTGPTSKPPSSTSASVPTRDHVSSDTPPRTEWPRAGAAAPARRSRWPRIVVSCLVVTLALLTALYALRSPPEPAKNDAGPVASPTATVTIRGGGSTFARPLMERWAELYQQKQGVTIEYSAVGSSKGLDGLQSRFLDFACTELPLRNEGTGSQQPPVVHIPLALGAVVPTYNLSDRSGQAIPLQFTGPLLAEIFLGVITTWDHESIQANNPGVELPSLPIQVIHRSEGSGTTALWTEYLASVSADWKDRVGRGATVNWPTGRGAEGNGGIADLVSSTRGAIGYVELGYTFANGLPAGRVKNRAGVAVTPSSASIQAAVGELKSLEEGLTSLINQPDRNAYPIVGICWAVLHATPPAGRGPELARFLRWAITDGQQHVESMHYAAIPTEIREQLLKRIDRLK